MGISLFIEQNSIPLECNPEGITLPIDTTSIKEYKSDFDMLDIPIMPHNKTFQRLFRTIEQDLTFEQHREMNSILTLSVFKRRF